MSKNINDEDFDKDIEIAKLQVTASMWAAVFSVGVTTAFALIGGALLALVALVITNPTQPPSAPAVVAVALVECLGIFIVAINIRKNNRLARERKEAFAQIYEKVKAERVAHTDKERSHSTSI